MSSESDSRSVVIIGGGQAGYEAAVSLRAGGFAEAIRIVSDEPYLPYQRPPLSKEPVTPERISGLSFTSAELLSRKGIELLSGVRAESIDRHDRRIRLSSGTELAFGKLIIATGARNRAFSFSAPEGVFSLRGIEDAMAMRERLAVAKRLAVIGAGFLGLEVAAVAHRSGIPVEVIEATAIPMGRGLSAPTSAAIVAHLVEKGIAIRTGTAVSGFESRLGRLTGVRLADGTVVPADAALVSIGIVPNAELAAECGLKIANGVAVDRELRTADPGIYAIGDCAAFDSVRLGGRVRLESVQNAIDHGKHVARSILGESGDYDALPWFWSDLDKTRLQIAGWSTHVGEVLVRGDIAGCNFTGFCFHEDRLVIVEAVNRPADYMAGRRCLAAGIIPQRSAFDDAEFAFASWVKAQTTR